MGMVVQHNLNAMTAYNKLNTNVAGLKKSSEKLASGFRINRAGDDAAGLAISEKMRSQIRGLNQAVRNSQDGINMIQTYEGAAQETHNILQRMKELALESANGTYDNNTDRDAIQLEFDQLNDELNQIADTDFNGHVALNGGVMADGTIVQNAKTVAGIPFVATNAVDDNTYNFVYHQAVHGLVDRGLNGSINIDGVSVEIKGGWGLAEYTYEFNGYDHMIAARYDCFLWNDADGNINGSMMTRTSYFINEQTTSVTLFGKKYNIKWGVFNDGQLDPQLVDENGEVISWLPNGAMMHHVFWDYDNDGNQVNFRLELEHHYEIENGVVTSSAFDTTTGNFNEVTFGKIDYKEGVSVSNAFEHGRRNLTHSDSITLQTGARSKDAVDFTFEYVTSGIGDLDADMNISARGLGTDQLRVNTAEKANEAIDHIDNAINKVSMVRATFGAIQNRLEHKIDNLTTTSTNLSEAESNIRDTDMANEMMNYTKFNILQQAAQSMLAQANQQPQSILQLLG